MTDPKRLVEEGDLGAVLLASARGDRSPDGVRARVAGAIGLAAGAAVLTTSSAAGGAGASAGAGVAKAAVAGVWVKIVAAGVVAAAVTGGGIVATSSSRAPSVAPTETTRGAQPPSVTGGAHATAVAPVNPAPEPVATARTEAPPPTAVSSKAAAVSARPQPSAESRLARELESLDRARTVLDRGDPGGALAALDHHERAFPRGALRTEAQILRAEAMLARGDKAGARALARQLLARDPSGPHARRLRTLAGDD